MRMFGCRALSSMLVVIGCNVEYERTPQNVPPVVDDSFDERVVERAAVSPPPITGGTLLVTHDGALAVASDPDRDVVHVVDLEEAEETATIALPPGSRPFRGAEDAAGLVHVTLRGAGQVATIDPIAGTLVSLTKVCPNPRGIAYHDERDAVVVACAGGQLVELDASDRGVIDRRWVARDLRDVFVADGSVFVSRFREAEVLEVSDTEVFQDGAPLSPSIAGFLRSPSTAWRTVPTPDGGWLMLHQLASTTPLPGPAPGEEFRETDAFDDGGGEGYGGAAPCGGATNPTLTRRSGSGELLGGEAVLGIALAVDVAMSPDGYWMVIASPSQHDEFRSATARTSLTRYSSQFLAPGSDRGCSEPQEVLAVGDFVAVAYTPDGRLVAQTRAKPTLQVFLNAAVLAEIELAGDPVVDSGHDLFHLDTGDGIACASCHPEGGDDGRVWAFVEHGPRRTQSLEAGLAGTEPFHWQGDMPDMHVLVDEVRARRMGGAELSDERAAALRDWVFSIPQPNKERVDSDPYVERGSALFTQLQCRTCHAGAAFTSPTPVRIAGGEPLQIPNLRGVALRAPFMHDGRCRTLECAVQEMVETTSPTPWSSLTLEDVAALVAYLETL